ncbi:hypothetical protein BDN70DRAFT_957800 [Pholiota conissans]|uniref:Uncharacterized protein n=1 Tax=Pholiota conissans TaxID=109636 RepID=A0A9P5YU64_9AGAR|nr:hypothetical protein BDN70DRAFT_957800 [Pholiota conissans]
MPEERTVSAFTWITPPLRSRLRVGQMAARTIVRQHYSTENKSRKHAVPKPTVKFYDIKSKIFNSTSDRSESDLLLDDEDDAWLDEPLDPNVKNLTAERLDAESNSAINLQSKTLSTFLSLYGDNLQAEDNKDLVNATQVEPNPDDNDFSMSF